MPAFGPALFQLTEPRKFHPEPMGFCQAPDTATVTNRIGTQESRTWN